MWKVLNLRSMLVLGSAAAAAAAALLSVSAAAATYSVYVFSCRLNVTSISVVGCTLLLLRPWILLLAWPLLLLLSLLWFCTRQRDAVLTISGSCSEVANTANGDGSAFGCSRSSNTNEPSCVVPNTCVCVWLIVAANCPTRSDSISLLGVAAAAAVRGVVEAADGSNLWLIMSTRTSPMVNTHFNLMRGLMMIAATAAAAVAAAFASDAANDSTTSAVTVTLLLFAPD